MVSETKMSKKSKEKRNSQRRVTWGFNPVTRIVASKKVYNRKKMKGEYA